MAVGSVMGGGAAVHDAHDDGAAAAILEVLLDRVAQCAGLPQAAEHARGVVEAADRTGSMHGPVQRAADEGSDAVGTPRDGIVRTGSFGGWDLRVKRLGQSTPQNVSPTMYGPRNCAAQRLSNAATTERCAA